MLTAMLVVLGWNGSAPRPAQALAPTAHVAVLPLVIPEDADAAWVRLGGMDLVADRLRRRGLAVAPSESTLSALKASPATNPAAIGALLRQTLDTAVVVAGTVARDGGGWQVHLDATMPTGPALAVQARDGDLLPALRSATDRLLGAFGRAPAADTEAGPAGVAEIAQRVHVALLADDPAAKNDGLDPDDSTDHQQSLIEFSNAGDRATSAAVFTFPSNGINTAMRSYPSGVLVDADNRTLIWGWRNWEFTQGPFVMNRDITVSRFVDDDALFGNGFGGAYAD